MSNTTGIGYGFNSPTPYNRRKGGPRFDDLQASSAVNRHIVHLHRRGKNWREIGETLNSTFPHDDQVKGLRDKQKAVNERGLKFRLHVSIRQGLDIPATWLYEYVRDAIAATGSEQQASQRVIEACRQGNDIPSRTAWACRRWLDSCFQIDGRPAMDGRPANSSNIQPGNDPDHPFVIEDSTASKHRPFTGTRGRRNPPASDEEQMLDIPSAHPSSSSPSEIDSEPLWSTSSGSTWNFQNPSPRFRPWTNPPPASSSSSASSKKKLLAQLSQLHSQHHSAQNFLQTQKCRLAKARELENEAWRELGELRGEVLLLLPGGVEFEFEDVVVREEGEEGQEDEEEKEPVELELELDFSKRNWSPRADVRALQEGIEGLDFAGRVRYEAWRGLAEERTGRYGGGGDSEVGGD
ncbi:Hypothetical predicted protein [Lecanosticta acicola]|uniref:Uncharacterized protein n=1 Tax=Lecanosticta acicola TaxID=111012 RepID=A0AAI8Z616_9PEZI|nr:Hypothetical predicted protein [Lecanosticta acicola]